MITRVELEGMHFFAFHGYYEEERKMGNNFILNVAVELKTFDDKSDGIDQTVNYESIFNICKTVMNETQLLLESVVLLIIEKIQKQFSHVLGGEVRLEKMAPQLGGKVEKAVVTMKF